MGKKLQSKPTTELLTWYDQYRREMPWRALPEQTPELYHVWLSEIMLQQTTVQTVRNYFLKFTRRWPTIEELALADLDDVLTAWAGLGYYARARNLHKCAREIVKRHGGVFPGSQSELEALPGIGPYTSAAIMAIGLNKFAVVVDGNVERVTTRLFSLITPLPKVKAEVRTEVEKITCTKRPGDFAQAMMDLGATICKPRNPLCASCPLSFKCSAFENGNPENYPFRLKKKKRPVKFGSVFMVVDKSDHVFLQKRPEKGLLGGMMELPGTDWLEKNEKRQIVNALPFDADWTQKSKQVSHIFTHFELKLDVYHVVVDRPQVKAEKSFFKNGKWVPLLEIEHEALPSLMKKALQCGLEIE